VISVAAGLAIRAGAVPAAMINELKELVQMFLKMAQKERNGRRSSELIHADHPATSPK
jgi:hypothetical protein